jgi:hypothetical protein
MGEIQVAHVCATPEACLCSSSGDECCCIYPPDAPRGTTCRNCGAPIVAIDFETGEPLTRAEGYLADIAFDVASLTRAHVSLCHAETEARQAGRTEHANNLAYADAVILVARNALTMRRPQGPR